jgi:hypothetical protein
MSKKLRILCRLASSKEHIARYRRGIADVETLIERDLAAGYLVSDTDLLALIGAYIIDGLEGIYQGKTGQWDWYLSKADRKVAIDNLKPYFQTKYNILPKIKRQH